MKTKRGNNKDRKFWYIWLPTSYMDFSLDFKKM